MSRLHCLSWYHVFSLNLPSFSLFCFLWFSIADFKHLVEATSYKRHCIFCYSLLNCNVWGSNDGGGGVKTKVNGGWFDSQTDAHLAAPFRLCFNVAQPEGHVPLLASQNTLNCDCPGK